MCTPEEIVEIKKFSIMVFTFDMIAECSPSEEIAGELIILAASYGPPKIETKGQGS